jgi:hypothetical protein
MPSRHLERALRGDRPLTCLTVRVQRYDWDRVADCALAAYRRAIDGTW